MKTSALLFAMIAVSVASSARLDRRRSPVQRPLTIIAAPIAAASSISSVSHVSPSNEVYLVKESPLDNIGVDGYHYGYQLSDGSARDESAQVQVHGPEQATLRVQGSYSYYNPEDGKTYTISYIADENGFQPQGAHLPVAPKA